jgi:hypothetical protein
VLKKNEPKFPAPTTKSKLHITTYQTCKTQRYFIEKGAFLVANTYHIHWLALTKSIHIDLLFLQEVFKFF